MEINFHPNRQQLPYVNILFNTTIKATICNSNIDWISFPAYRQAGLFDGIISRTTLNPSLSAASTVPEDCPA